MEYKINEAKLNIKMQILGLNAVLPRKRKKEKKKTRVNLIKT